MKPRLLMIPVILSMLLGACAPAAPTAVQQSAAPAAQIAVLPTAVVEKPTAALDTTQTQNGEIPSQGGETPPEEVVTACTNKSEQDACEFTSNKGTETGVCETVQTQLACSPKNGGGQAENQPSGGGQADAIGSGYNIEQAISDKAQGMTISYDALAFLTGDLGADSFFPPGKVADFWGFQYLRDNDPSQMGHAGEFLTSAAMNMLNTLTAAQRTEMVALAKNQVASINEYGCESPLG